MKIPFLPQILFPGEISFCSRGFKLFLFFPFNFDFLLVHELISSFAQKKSMSKKAENMFGGKEKFPSFQKQETFFLLSIVLPET
jgi:hypothetical protein